MVMPGVTIRKPREKRLDHNRQAAKTAYDLTQKFEPLGSDVARLARKSDKVASWPRKTCGDPLALDRRRGRAKKTDRRQPRPLLRARGKGPCGGRSGNCLMSSNSTGCWTGRSAGFAPLSILST
jgi:hypothetical protein